jgi:hypothetical protein
MGLKLLAPLPRGAPRLAGTDRFSAPAHAITAATRGFLNKAAEISDQTGAEASWMSCKYPHIPFGNGAGLKRRVGPRLQQTKI